MSKFRLVLNTDIAPPEHSPVDRGPKPTFDWLPIANLRVNETYQRPLKRENLTHIRRIAAAFNWVKFGALTVAPIEGTENPQLYAIINGQHRATAAGLLRINTVPCVIVEADEAMQAAAFRGLNSDVIRVHALTSFNAAVVSGDPAALVLKRVCDKAGVEVCPYPIQATQMRPGQTLAVGTIEQMLKRLGADTMTLALRCITGNANNLPGAVHANVIWAIGEVLGADIQTRARSDLIEMFGAIELDTLDSDSRTEKARHLGDSARARLRDKIRAAIEALTRKAA